MASKRTALTPRQKREANRQYQQARKNLTDEDVWYAMDKAQATYDEIITSSISWIRWLAQYAKLTHWMLVDWWNEKYSASWKIVAAFGAALLYFVLPFDVIPDVVPVLGWLDDAFVFGIAARLFDDELEDYVQRLKIDTSEFDAIYELED